MSWIVFWVTQIEHDMSALGQKQTFAVHKFMSAKCQKRSYL